jgi:hypothetical protein
VFEVGEMAAKVCFGSAGDLGLRCLPPEIFRMILQYLDVPNEIRVLDEAILNHELRSLYLQSLHGMTIEEFICSDETTVMDIFWLLEKQIRLSQIHLTKYYEGILLLIFQSRLTLTSLTISFSPSFPSGFLSDLARIGNFPSLMSFTSDNWPQSSAYEFISFCSTNPQLEDLDFYMVVTDMMAISIFSIFIIEFPHLRILNLSQNKWFNDECVEILTKAAPKLESLDVSSTQIQSLQSIKSILDTFPSLTYLSISKCPVSVEVKKYYFREFCVRGIRSNDRQLQVNGLDEMSDILWRVSHKTSFLLF